MDKRIKLVIVGLIGILIISLFLSLQLSGSRQTAVRERDDLKRENLALTQKIDASFKDSRRLEDKINSLNLDLNRVAKEKDEMQKKFDIVNKERQELIDKLKEKKPAPEVVVQAAPVTEDAYWAGILRAKTDLELQLEDVRGQLKVVQTDSAQLQREKGSLNLEVSSLTREREDLRRQLEYARKVMDGISQELVREKNDKFKIAEMIKVIKNENEVLRRQLNSIDTHKGDLEERISGLQEENAQLDSRLREMETLLQDRAAQIDTLNRQLDIPRSDRPASSRAEQRKGSVELPPIVVRPQGDNAEAPDELASAGKVLAINRDNNFVVIDIGSDKGVKIGDVFEVYRDNQNLGRVEIIQVRDKISACDIKKESTPINVGDKIK